MPKQYQARRPPKSSQKSRSTTGEPALSRMAKWSVDQARSFATARYTGKKAPGNIAKDLLLLKSLINAEEKHSDILFDVSTVTNASPVILPLPTMAQGNSGETRTGDSIKVIRVDMSLRFAYGTGTSNSVCDQVFKWFLVRYLKTPVASGTTPFTIGEFLDADFSGNRSCVSLFSTDQMENFQVMQSGIVDVAPNFALAAVNNVASVILDVSHECSFHQTYNGSASTTICDNMCFLVVLGALPNNTAGTSTINGSMRLFYLDN
jgi:hypothetical protein